MHKWVWVLCLLPSLAWAGDRVCGDSTDTASPTAGLASYVESVDNTDLPAGCVAVPKDDIPAQRALKDTPGFDRRKYRVVNGLMTLKSQSVRDAIDAADTAAASVRAAILAEFTTNEACNVTSLQEAIDKIETQRAAIQTDIDAVTNIATAKAALTSANARLTAIDKNIAKCLFAIIKVTIR
jgi:tryptophan 2,3-dioxygenase